MKLYVVTNNKGRSRPEWFENDECAASALGTEAWTYRSTKIVGVRPATEKEQSAYLAEANAIDRQVRAEEFCGSTKSLPDGWEIDERGRTLNQFGDAVDDKNSPRTFKQKRAGKVS